MRISCSQCGTLHILPAEKAADHENFIMTCDGCGRRIKTARCPDCGTSYSITFDFVKNTRYRVRCKKCLAEFFIHFPIEYTLPAGPSRERKRGEPDEENRLPAAPAGRDPLKPPTSIDGRESIYSIGGFFSAIGSAFSPLKVFLTSGFIAAVIAVLALVEALWARLTFPPGVSRFLLHLTSLSHVMLFFIIYLLGAGIVAGITLDDIRNIEEPGIGNRLRDAAGHIAPVVAVTAGTVFLSELAILIFGRIPLVGTLFYALLFLPVYVLSLSIVTCAAVGFWFYPPLIAERGSGFFGSLRGFYRFVLRHKVSLLPNMCMLTAGTLAATGFLYLLHRAGLSMALWLSRAVPGSETSRLFPSIPPGFSLITGLLPAGISTALSSPGTGLSSAQGAAAFILGLGLSVVTVLLMGLFISITATLSALVYYEMEEKTKSDEKSRFYLLGLLMLLLFLMYLARRSVFFLQ